MSYKIAVASSDGVYIDLHFGGVEEFIIVDVKNDGRYTIAETRNVPHKRELRTNSEGCNQKNGCGDGCNTHNESVDFGSSHNCGGGNPNGELEEKVKLLQDCRCILCKKIGPSAEKLLSKKAITVFEIEVKVEIALAKIIDYYWKVDQHISLRKA